MFLGFSTPTRRLVKSETYAGWIFTRLSIGRTLRSAFRVSGAKCLKRATLASPFPRTDATQTILDTEPASELRIVNSEPFPCQP